MVLVDKLNEKKIGKEWSRNLKNDSTTCHVNGIWHALQKTRRYGGRYLVRFFKTFFWNATSWAAEALKTINRFVAVSLGCAVYWLDYWWMSVKGFWRGERSNLGLFHWLSSSSLEHCLTAVRVSECVIRLSVATQRHHVPSHRPSANIKV